MAKEMTIDVDARTAVCEMDTKPYADAPEEETLHHTVRIDFSNVSDEDVYAEAVRSWKIKLQGRIRRKPDTFPEGDVIEMDASEEIKREALTPFERALRIARSNALTDEQKRAIAEEMGATYSPRDDA